MHKPNRSYQVKTALVAVALLFLVMGVLTSFNDLLIPYLKEAYHLSYFESSLIQVVWFCAYLITGYPFGLLVRRSSYQNGMVGGYLICGLGCLLIFPAWIIDQYYFFLCILFVLGSGVSLLQVVSNPYGQKLGNEATAHRRLVLLHSLFALGSTLTPWIAGLYVFTPPEEVFFYDNMYSTSRQRTSTLIMPYMIFAFSIFIFAIINWRLPMPDLIKKDLKPALPRKDSAWQYSHTIFGALAAFFYVGTEVLIGSFIINLIKIEVPEMNLEWMPVFVSLYWGGILIGRLCGPFLLAIFSARNLLKLSAFIALSLVLVGIFGSGMLAVIAVTLCGLSNSVMFPIIYSLAMKGLSPETAAQASGIVSSAIAGGAVMPLLAGIMADINGLQSAFWVSFVCYAFILFYGFYRSE